MNHLVLSFSLLTFMASSNIFADFGKDKICGSDDRVLSKDAKIGRATKINKTTDGGCTVTLISNSCAITAGHCRGVLEEVQFNTPYSRNRVPQSSVKEDTYLVDRSSIKFQKLSNAGTDWAVFRLKKNVITKKFPGEVQGSYKLTFDQPKIGDLVTITGYGTDDKSIKGRKGHLAQQTHTGEVLSSEVKSIKGNWGGAFTSVSHITYNTDTMPGNSGSVIILDRTSEIVGIHTYGTCNSVNEGSNGGTMLFGKPDLQDAIKDCLASEKE